MDNDIDDALAKLRAALKADDDAAVEEAIFALVAIGLRDLRRLADAAQRLRREI